MDERTGYCECGCGNPAPLARQTETRRGWIKGQPLRFIQGHGSRRPHIRARMAEEARARGKRMAGEANPSWRGDDAGYAAIHAWMRRHHPFAGVCEECGATGRRTEWANTGHTYQRVREDWRELCVPCHRRQDGWRDKVTLAAQAKRRAPT